jgi:hypothetical protein
MAKFKLNSTKKIALTLKVSSEENEWNKLEADEGEGSYCCGKRMILAPSEIVYECLKCGGWEYSSS